MKKKFLSLIMCVCIFVCAVSCSITAFAAAPVVGALGADVRVCPGKHLTDATAPTISGDVTAQGWRVQKTGGMWVEYDGSVIDKSFDGAKVMYYAENADGIEYSSEATLVVAHDGAGALQSSALKHWRICADCGAKCDSAFHTMVDGQCTVCGHETDYAFTIVIGVFQMIYNMIASILGS